MGIPQGRTTISRKSRDCWSRIPWYVPYFRAYFRVPYFRKEARVRYRRFVLEGLGQSGLWDGLRQQIYLGNEKFVERMQARAQVSGDVLTVPQAQRRPPAPSLAAVAASHGERNAAMVAAYATGAYSYREIAAHFGVHLATVGRIVRGAMQ